MLFKTKNYYAAHKLLAKYVDELLYELNDAAICHDKWRYGLPVEPNNIQMYRDIVLKWLDETIMAEDENENEI